MACGVFDVLDCITANSPTFKGGLDPFERYFKTMRPGIEPEVVHGETSSQ